MADTLNQYKSNLTAEEVDRALHDIAHLNEGIDQAQEYAENAAESAEQSRLWAQQSLGFRTFFGAVSPDASGDVDPSRPMTTAAAQASWTVKSRGDRLQSVQVNGFTTQAGSGAPSPSNPRPINTAGLRMVELPLLSSYSWSASGNYFMATISAPLCSATNQFNAVGTQFCNVAQIGLPDGSTTAVYLESSTGQLKARFGVSGISGLAEFKAFLDNTGATIWYVPSDTSQATGLYIPVQVQGHEYRGRCLPINAALCAGDSLQTNVDQDGTTVSLETHAFAVLVLDGTQPGLAKHDTYTNRIALKLPLAKTSHTSETSLSDRYPYGNLQSGGAVFAITPDGYLNIEDPRFSALDMQQIKDLLAENPPTFVYALADAAIYTHPAVDLVAVPYTSADSGKTPGTYEVSSQDGTTVQVSLKAMQDGGDAATIGGQTLSAALLDLVYPVGSIYMSANNVSPQVFLGGTWQAIGGRFLLGADSSYKAGSTGGEAMHTLTLPESPAHVHNVLQGWNNGGTGQDTLGYASTNQGARGYQGNSGGATQSTLSSVGGNQPHNNMPPYLAVYMWKRTA